MNEKTYTVARTNSCYRPYSITLDNGCSYQINKIVLYNEEYQIEIDRGWLEQTNLDAKPYSYTSDILSFDLEQLRRANKVNLDKKDNFLVTHKQKYDFDNKVKKALYLYVPSLKFEQTNEDMTEEKTAINYVDIYSFDMDVIKQGHELDKNKELKYIDVPINKVFIKHNNKTVKTEKGKNISKLADKMSEVINGNITTYDVERLLEAFEIKEVA